MTDFERDWKFDSNYVVEGANFNEQAAYSWWRVLRFLRGLVGVDEDNNADATNPWTFVNASDGSGGALGAGTITDPLTDFVWNTAGSNHTWLHLSRAGLAPANTLHLVIDFNFASRASATLVLMPGSPTGAGTATDRPTHTDEDPHSVTTFFNNTTFVPRHVHGWRSELGEFMIAFARDGVGFPENGIWLPRFDDGEVGTVWPLNLFAANNAAARGAFDNAQINQSANWSAGFWQDSTPLTATKTLLGELAAATSAWTTGRSAITGDIPCSALSMWWNTVAAEAGYPGRIVDMRSAPNGVPDNESPLGDTDPAVYISMGELAVPWRRLAGTMVV